MTALLPPEPAAAPVPRPVERQPRALRAQALGCTWAAATDGATDSAGHADLVLDHSFAAGRITLVLVDRADHADALLDTLALRRRPVGGALFAGGVDLTALDRATLGGWRKRHLRLVRPAPIVPEQRNVLRLLHAELADHDPQITVPRAVDLLGRLEMGRRLGARIGLLSAAERHVLDFVVALSVMPRYLLLTDFTKTLPLPLAARVARTAQRHARSRNAAIIVISDEVLLETFADEIVDLRTSA